MFKYFFFFISAGTIPFINAFFIYFRLMKNRKKEKFSRQHSTTKAQGMEKRSRSFYSFFLKKFPKQIV